MTEQEMIEKVRAYRQAKDQCAALEARMEALKAELRAAMGHEEQMRVGDFKVSAKVIITTRIDAKALRAAEPEIAARFTAESIYERFTIA